ncbi:MAG: hypothetical protein Unbinned2072contig1001_14 [Prokaryotic dsDNA virus sp.]|nr:MAG: hypothetical protein Unbinned2072contig1001_14 [Prokaryotic dsDNA virus sp.]|tara:strand:- start:6924 stop:7307 length:384 start_codon:yes stop_codon:yes gene_type:complete
MHKSLHIKKEFSTFGPMRSIKKKSVLEALEKSLGIVSTACKKVGISRRTYYNWYNNDSVFKAAVDDINEMALDYAESKLHGLIKDSNVAAILFYLKTKGKSRGFIERNEVAVEGNIESKVIEWKPAE